MNRQEFFEKVRDKVASEEIPRITEAYWLAKVVHRNQKRDCGERYFEHCRRVACLLIDRGGDISADEIITALIHDCVEDGFIPDDVIQNIFGEKMRDAVATLSKVTIVSDKATGVVQKKRKSDEEYFSGIRDASVIIRRIKLADRLDNLRSMHASWTKERKQKYSIETETYILPIARMTDDNFAREIEEEIRRVFHER